MPSFSSKSLARQGHDRNCLKTTTAGLVSLFCAGAESWVVRPFSDSHFQIGTYLRLKLFTVPPRPPKMVCLWSAQVSMPVPESQHVNMPTL